jgi:hypothetical protein
MYPFKLQTAVLFLVFNRPDTTAQVFEAIRKARPPRLYVASDGARSNREGEAEKVAKVREIATAVDWPCEVKTLFRDQNLGCKQAVSSGITWFFEHEEEGIILEDDCLPHPNFFNFCETLLNKYKDDEKIFAITGNNFQSGQWRGDGSYYFSRYNHVWGWASWRRAWIHYDGDLNFWPSWKNSVDWTLKIPNKTERKYWTKIFDQMYACKIDTWDYPWTSSVWYHGGLTATPNVNLISNIGFGRDSTHTKSKNSPYAAMKTKALGQIIHPTEIKQNELADGYTFKHHFGGKYLKLHWRLMRFSKRVLVFLLRKLKFLNTFL